MASVLAGNRRGPTIRRGCRSIENDTSRSPAGEIAGSPPFEGGISQLPEQEGFSLQEVRSS